MDVTDGRADDGQQSVEYARRVYDNVESWYTSADNKAQILLALDGAALAFFTATVFADPGSLSQMLLHFDFETYAYLTSVGICVGMSVFCALMCLRSRMPRGGSVEISAKTMWFFWHLGRLTPEDIGSFLKAADDSQEIEALAAQLNPLSRNVEEKHRWVNRGFAFLISGLLFLLLMEASYVLHVAHGDFSDRATKGIWIVSVLIPFSVWCAYRHFIRKEDETHNGRSVVSPPPRSGNG